MRILRRFSVSISKLASNFKEANKKLIIVKGSEKLLKDLENHQRIHRKNFKDLQKPVVSEP
jgi:hypothetical protein